ncbi:MGDG synthase family glycosyltransferase [Salibacterium aidingense]|uniref:MGDG synthase family glycosyltransferase n=1 Tax=Salibacterium aidingense TaxID=384933 RepID=UPI0003FC546A|nr:glycosyltransferase [Salibacterium aidingense]
MRIHIWTASYGYGHIKAALLLQQELQARNHEAVICRPLENKSPLLHKWSSRGYRGVLRWFPAVWRKCCRRRLSAFISVVADHYQESIQQALNADLVLSVHPLLSAVAAEGKKKNKKPFLPLYHIATDYWDPPITHHPEVDGYFLPALPGQAPSSGTKPVFPFGLPVEPKNKPYTKKECCLEHGWDQAKPLLLVCGGGDGNFPFQKKLAELCSLPAPATIVFMTGTKKWSAKQRSARHHVITLPFTERFTDYLQAADILITKGGGMTLTEAALYETPTIIVSPLPGQEERNTAYFIKHHAAYAAFSSRSMRQETNLFMQSPFEREKMKRRLRRLQAPDSTARIIDTALRLAAKSGASTQGKQHITEPPT